jgi:DNA polymerase III delta prime subunit
MHLSNKGINAVFKLSQGDMRRIVNMLQSLSLLGHHNVIEENDIYAFTGNPSP